MKPRGRRHVYFGNCFFGAIALMWMRRSFGLRIEFLNYLPYIHFYVKDRAGKNWHFRTVANILPWPLFWMLFIGAFRPWSPDWNEPYTNDGSLCDNS